jgi:hypothetical protein
MQTNDKHTSAALQQREGRAEEAGSTQSQALWRMTPEERERAMWAGELTFAQLREWSSLRPDEVPKIGGELAWIAMKTPDWAEAEETAGAQQDIAA